MISLTALQGTELKNLLFGWGYAQHRADGRIPMNTGLLTPLAPHDSFFGNCRPRIASIYRYWDDRRGDRWMPKRADIDPADFTEHLAGIMLIDVEGEDTQGRGIFRYRVVGTREVANRRQDPTGKRVEDGFFAESLDAALRAYESVRRQRAPIFEALCFISPEGIPIEEDSIMLPLSENGTDVSQILVYSESRGDDALVPLRPYAAQSAAAFGKE
jgi:hypothetical protein